MKKVIRLSESDLLRIVRKTLKEDKDKNLLYNNIKDLLRDSYESQESKVFMLRQIADELESGMKLRNDVSKRWSKEKEDR
jgi:uncharacterized NAD(P)/FAD-binding protein YdhS